MRRERLGPWGLATVKTGLRQGTEGPLLVTGEGYRETELQRGDGGLGMKIPGITVETRNFLSMVHVLIWSLLLLQTPTSGVSGLDPRAITVPGVRCNNVLTENTKTGLLLWFSPGKLLFQ